MNSYHRNINLTIEITPKKFLDTKILRTSNQIQCFMYQKENKKPIHWNSAVPKSYKRNVIIGDVHRAKRISCDFDYEISVKKVEICQSWLSAQIRYFCDKCLYC